MAHAGFGLSLLMLIVSWYVFYICGILVVKANLWFPEGTNFVGMARKILGKRGEACTWFFYLLLLYSLIAAYLTGASDLLNQLIYPLMKFKIPSWQGSLIWVALLSGVIWRGPHWVDYLNRILLFGLIAGYAFLLAIASPEVKPVLLTERPQNSWVILMALPVLATSFGYHVVLPTVRIYLRSNFELLKRAIFFGSLIPLVVYALWNFMVFGVIPVTGHNGLAAIHESGGSVSELIDSLRRILFSVWIMSALKVFAFSALASSFLGVATSFFDFIADGLKIHKSSQGKIALIVLTFGPPLLYALFFPKGFILALSYGGVFVAFLHCILPALLVWKGSEKFGSEQLSVRYKFNLSLIMLFAVLVAAGQVVSNLL